MPEQAGSAKQTDSLEARQSDGFDSPEALREKKRAALSSLFAAVLLTALKLAAGAATGSLGILAEAAHSALDLVAAGVTVLAIRIASRPPDKHHNYGHGKAEHLAALAETLLLLLTCVWIVGESVDRLFFNPAEVRLSVWALLVMGISIVVDVSRARMLSRVAKKHKSQALEADALHFSSDVLSSGVVILGLLAVGAAAWFPADSLTHKILLRADSGAALAVAALVAVVSLRLGVKAVNQLLDAGNTDLQNKLELKIGQMPKVKRISRMRIRESGSATFVDMSIILPSDLSLEEAHAVADMVENAVHELAPGADVLVHVEPSGDDGQEDLISRIQRMALEDGVEVHAVEVYYSGSKRIVLMHAVADGDSSLAEAHESFERLEARLSGPGLDVSIRLEPSLREEFTRAEPLDPASAPGPDAEQAVREAVEREPMVSGYHRFNWFRTHGGSQMLSFHCCMPGSVKVRDSHRAVHNLESYIRNKCPALARITIHTDPLENQEKQPLPN